MSVRTPRATVQLTRLVRDSAQQCCLDAWRRSLTVPDSPRRFTGHLRAALHDGTHREVRQAHLRGGVDEPLSTGEIEQKFMDNARHGGWTAGQTERLLHTSRELFRQPTLDILKEFRA